MHEGDVVGETKMTNNSNSNDGMTNKEQGWQQCDDQDLQHLSSRLKDSRVESERKQQFQAASLLASAAALFLATGLSFVIWGGSHANGLTCQTVLANATEFLQNQMDETMRLSVIAHLRHCDSCRDTLTEMNQEAGNPPLELSQHYELYDPQELVDRNQPIFIASLGR